MGKTRVPREKPLRAREKTNDEFNPHMSSTLRASLGGGGGGGDFYTGKTFFFSAHKEIGGWGVVKKTVGLVRSSYGLPKIFAIKAVKLTLFAPCFNDMFFFIF